MPTTKILMDVDTGIDDAIAIIVASQSPDIEIVGITTVTGNVTSESAGLNTLGILKAVGLESKIPVLQGASRPLSKSIGRLRKVHGKDGLGNVKLVYDPAHLQKGNPSRFISEILGNYRKKEVSLVATGPLTNIAGIVLDDSEIINNLSKICIMGGAFGLTYKQSENVAPHAEFNFYSDPKAAHIVLNSKSTKAIRKYVVGLNVTDKFFMVTREFLSLLSEPQCIKSNNLSVIARSLLDYPLSKFGSVHLPDVFAVAMVEMPDLFKFKKGQVKIVRRGIHRGESIFIEANTLDIDNDRKVDTCLTHVATKVTDQTKFYSYIISRLCSRK